VISTDVPGWGAVEYWAQDGIARIEDLKGKTIAVNSRGSGTDAAARIVLAQHGLKDGQDYQIVEMRFPAILPALETKRIDVGVLIQPFNGVAAKKPGLKRMFTMGDAFGPSETVSWTGKADWIAAHRAALVDFTEDNLRLRRWTEDPKTRPAALALMAKVAKQPIEALEPWLFTHADNYRDPEGRIDVARFQKNVDDLHKAGVIPGTIDAAKHIDTSIARDAAARLKN
jgi:NitT/TauT family transport system substrate-binding protein